MNDTKMNKGVKTKIRTFVWLFLLLGLTTIGKAGQPLIMNEEGTPVVWDNSGPIILSVEEGICGRFNNAEVLNLLEENLQTWSDISTASIDFEIVNGDFGAVDGCNYTDLLSGVEGQTTIQALATQNDGVNPVIIDNNGEIIEEATGVDNGRYFILGFANPDGFETNSSDVLTEIVDGQAVFNCYCAADENGNVINEDCEDFAGVFSDNEINFTMIHEVGHLLNLDHTQVNIDQAQDDVPAGEQDDIPIMFPVSINPSLQISATEDDKVALSALYPSSQFFEEGNTDSTYCKVSGTLLDTFDEELECADVQAENIDPNLTVSFTTGTFGVYNTNGFCESNCGHFELFLRPDEVANTTLTINDINPNFTGGSSIGPCVTTQLSDCSDVEDYVANCNDNDSDTNCQACIKPVTLTLNTDGDLISDLLTANCTAGQVVELGQISTESVAIASETAGTHLRKNRLRVDSPASLQALDQGQMLPRFAQNGLECSESSSGASCQFSAHDETSYRVILGLGLVFGLLLAFRVRTA